MDESRRKLFKFLLTLPTVSVLPALAEDAKVQVWGEKTLVAGSSPLEGIGSKRSYLLVAKLLKESYIALYEYLYLEPMDSIAISKSNLRFVELMAELSRSSLVEDFQVVCDECNNTPRSRNAGVINVDVVWTSLGNFSSKHRFTAGLLADGTTGINIQENSVG